MIAHVSGQVVEKTEGALIIDVSGLGYEVQVAAGDHEAAALGEKIKVYTYDHIRENSHELFGFGSLLAKRLFELLISVSGVGPKMALAILSLGDVEVIRNAIATNDSAVIQRASGVGKRIAERVVLDLREKVGLPGAAPASANPTAPQMAARDDALDALLSLGYNLQQANEALQGVDQSLSVEEKIKMILKKGI